MSNSVPGAIFCFLIGLSGRKAWWEVTLITTLVAGLGTWFIGGPGTAYRCLQLGLWLAGISDCARNF